MCRKPGKSLEKVIGNKRFDYNFDGKEGIVRCWVDRRERAEK